MKFGFRNTAVILAYVAFFTIALHVPSPPPIKVVAPTEAQMKGQLIRERREKDIARAVATARKVYREVRCSDTYSDLTGRTAYEFGVSPRLLAAVVFVESSCNPKAVSGRNSIGLLQVNPRVWGHRAELKDPVSNMRIGTRILKQYISQYGIREGLHHYNGLGDPTDTYANKVFAAGRISL